MLKKRENPPGLAVWLLKKVIPPKDIEFLLEEYYDDYFEIYNSKGAVSAFGWFWKQTLKTAPEFFIYSINIGLVMFFNYLKIAFRNIKKHKLYSLINVAGLGIGMAVSILIMFWVRDELSYDKFHTNSENLYRVLEKWYSSDGTSSTGPGGPHPLGPALVSAYPEIKESLHFRRMSENLIKYGNNNYFEDKICFAGSGFFKMFSFPLVKGDPETVLSDKNSMVISESIAKKYFGESDPIGKTINMNNTADFTITGIMKDVPHNSHLQFELIGSLDYLLSIKWQVRWVDHLYGTYLRLAPGTDAHELGKKIRTYINDNNHDPTTIDVLIQPVEDIHLRSNSRREIYVNIFSVIALIVILIACINFMNLSTAQSANRAKEIGLRKVVGAMRIQIIKQYFCESFLLTALSLVFALVTVYFLLPEFNTITGKNFKTEIFLNDSVIGYLVLITLITGISAAFYPALYLSSFRPQNILKGPQRAGSRSKYFRRILVVAQFSLSLILMIGMFIINNQIKFLKDTNLGVDKENIVYFQMRGELRESYEPFKTELMKHNGIKNVSTASGSIMGGMGGTTGVDWEGKEANYRIDWNHMSVDFDFFSTFGLKIKEGRGFSRKIMSDKTSAYIINETAAEAMALKNPVGKKFIFWQMEGTIIGVMNDFNYQSLHNRIDPLMLRINPKWQEYSKIFVKIQSENISGVIGHIKDVNKKFNPGFPLRIHFFDEEYGDLYMFEDKVRRLFKYFSILAIFISCLGVFGLSSFLAEQRSKEISIRKTLGATNSGLVILLSREFFKWILIANVFAWPVGWYVMKNWLNSFAYRTEIGISVFVIAGALAYLITMATISFQTIKAALANPVDSLRND